MENEVFVEVGLLKFEFESINIGEDELGGHASAFHIGDDTVRTEKFRYVILCQRCSQFSSAMTMTYTLVSIKIEIDDGDHVVEVYSRSGL